MGIQRKYKGNHKNIKEIQRGSQGNPKDNTKENTKYKVKHKWNTKGIAKETQRQ